jgi:hypothetical protein
LHIKKKETRIEIVFPHFQTSVLRGNFSFLIWGISAFPLGLNGSFLLYGEQTAGDEQGVGKVQRPSPKKNMVYGPLMPELTITSPYVHSRVELQNITMGNPMPESNLSPVRGFGFGLRSRASNKKNEQMNDEIQENN